ncbi:hypothetical protein D3C87_541060 [compost metagenome]
MQNEPCDRISACAMDWVFNRLGPDYRNDWPLPAPLADWLSKDPLHFQMFMHARRLWLLSQLLKPGAHGGRRDGAATAECAH